MQKYEISIVMVTYNSYPFFKKSIELIEKNLNDFSLEIIIVDNDSKDVETIEYLKLLEINNSEKFRFKIVKLNKNTGFSIGMNVGVSYASYKTILCFNNDIYLDVNSNTVFVAMYKYIYENTNVGIISPIFEKEDGSPDINYNLGFNVFNLVFDRLSRIFSNKSKYNSREILLAKNKDYVDVVSLSGQFFMMRRSTFDLIGGFDTRYFLYSSDWDVSEKINMHGLRNVIYTKGKLIHGVGSSSSRARYISTFDLYKSFAQFILKWKIIPFFRKNIYFILFIIPVNLEIFIRNIKSNKNVSE